MSSTNIKSEIDTRLLVTWLGTKGAIAGLQESQKCTVEILMQIAEQLGVSYKKKITRKELINEIIKVASKRIEKSLDELLNMEQEDLVRYFKDVGAESEELIELVKQLELDPGCEGHRNLVQYVAREISETGRFMRITSSEVNNCLSNDVKIQI